MEEPTAVLSSKSKGLKDFIFPLSIYVLSVSFIFGLAVVTARSPFMIGEVILPTYRDLPQLSEVEQVFLGPWQHWDGMWYLKIATHGYAQEDHSLAFYPGYPLLIRIIGDALGTIYLFSAVLISATSYAIGLVFLYKLARLEGNEPFARRSVLYLALFPTAFFFLAVYTESLFLALTISAFYFARRGAWAVAGILGMFAALTRSTGLLLAIPFVVEYLSQKHFKLRPLNKNRAEVPISAPSKIGFDASAVLLIPLGTAIYTLYNWWAFQDPLGFLTAQVHWERSIAWPWDTLWSAVWLSWTEPNHELFSPYSPSPIWQVLYVGNLFGGHAVNLVFFLFAAVLVTVGFRRLRALYTAYAVLALLVPLCNPSGLMPLLSTPRFVLVLFPIVFVLAHLGHRRAIHLVVLVSFLIALTVLTIRFAAGYWVA